jgi:hypothetical protein
MLPPKIPSFFLAGPFFGFRWIEDFDPSCHRWSQSGEISPFAKSSRDVSGRERATRGEILEEIHTGASIPVH